MTTLDGPATCLLTTATGTANRRRDAGAGDAAGSAGNAADAGKATGPARYAAAARSTACSAGNAAEGGTTGGSERTSGSGRAGGAKGAAGSGRAHTRTARVSSPASPLTLPARLLRYEVERPLVVMVPAEVKPDRFVFALAADAHQAAGNHAAADCAARRRARAIRRGPARRSSAPTPLTLLTGRARRADVIEVVVRDRIFVLLAEVVPLHEHVDARREGAILLLEQANRTGVLLSPEDELGFFLPLRLVAPHRQRDGHQDRHHSQRHQQRGHRITARAACPETRILTL